MVKNLIFSAKTHTFLLFTNYSITLVDVAVLIYVPRMEEFKVAGKEAGHYVTTCRTDKFRWLEDQLRKAGKSDPGCTHIKADISKVNKTVFYTIFNVLCYVADISHLHLFLTFLPTLHNVK